MLAIARGLMTEPRLMLLDEPSLGLAPMIIDTLFEQIEAINQTGTTIFLIERIPDDRRIQSILTAQEILEFHLKLKEFIDIMLYKMLEADYYKGV